jgi:uncharacterized Zn-binding protein involved in type VI secretion
MTVRVACQGDSITAGVQYVITRAGQNTVRINNRLVAVADPSGAAQVSNHPGGHNNIKIASGSSTIFIAGKPLARAGDPLTCGTHAISSTTGTILSTTVFTS